MCEQASALSMGIAHAGHLPNLQILLSMVRQITRMLEKVFAPLRIQVSKRILLNNVTNRLSARHAERMRRAFTRRTMLKATPLTRARAPTLRLWHSAVQHLTLGVFSWNGAHTPATGWNACKSCQFFSHSSLQLRWILDQLSDVELGELFAASIASRIKGKAI